ncbi:MAG: retropepsin-like aspartic protease [Chloroflexota bacterium]|nr:retropepsin-like aspartic protease [Chloroflexota bacterium]MDE2958469.1 retropepsin-like aspartic protease [Chloroflexota bacterium]
MSMFKVDVGVGNMEGGDLAPVRPMVDTGAAHSMLPESLLTRLGIAPRRELSFILADGTPAIYGFGFARLSIDGEECPCPVIFGPEGNHLLGASTLEIFNLVVDPAGERLLPAEWLSLGWGGEL